MLSPSSQEKQPSKRTLHRAAIAMTATKNGRQIHALVLPYPAQGHINPLLQFSKRLVSKGLKITFVNTIFLSKSILFADSKSPNIHFETISDGFDDGGYGAAENPAAYVESLKVSGSATLAQLIKKLEENGSPVDVLIYDSFLSWAPDVAKGLGVSTAAFFTQACAVNSVYYHVRKGILPLPLSGNLIELPGIPELQPREAPSFVYKYDASDVTGFLDMMLSQFSNVDQADWVLFNTFDKLEQDVLKWMGKLWRVRAVGPTVPSIYLDKRLEDDTGYGISLFTPDSSACMNWLNLQVPGSVVYVSFGSWSEINEQQIQEIASALKQCTFKFIWVVRSFEKQKLPANFTDETKDQGLVVTWSPQLEVLAHESVACFVTHCGFNSVLEALSLGVPVVAAPVFSDQPTNAKLLEEVWGVGVGANADEEGIVRKETLVGCLKEIMEGEKGKEINENSGKWKKLAMEAVVQGGSSDKNIDEFVAGILAR